MTAPELAFRSRRAATPEGLRPAAVLVRDGRIARVADPGEVPPGAALVEAGDSILLPGLVDVHVHVNEPGRTEWEGFASATRAAAAGGVTTLVDMPLNCLPPTLSAAALESKLQAAAGACRVDVGFWGGLVPGNAAELPGLAAAGVLGFKCFLTDPGVEEFPPVDRGELRGARGALAELGLPLLVHAEDPAEIAAAAPGAGADRRAYRTWLASRPGAAEVRAIATLLELCREQPFRLHVVHLASAAALPLLRGARQEGLPVTVETCPHYLTFAAGEIPDGATAFKCAPPIRERSHREELWRALSGGGIDLVASDHSPCPLRLKEGDFLTAWGGIASLQLLLPALWTGMRQRGLPAHLLARWLGREPARLAGLTGRKGEIAPGRDADLVIFDPQASFRVAASELQHRHPLTPYDGRELFGVVEATFLRGDPVYQAGEFPGPPRGRPIRGIESLPQPRELPT